MTEHVNFILVSIYSRKAGLTFVITYGLIQFLHPVHKPPTLTTRVIINHVFIKRLVIAMTSISVCYIRNHYFNFLRCLWYGIPISTARKAFAKLNFNTTINFDVILRSR